MPHRRGSFSLRRCRWRKRTGVCEDPGETGPVRRTGRLCPRLLRADRSRPTLRWGRRSGTGPTGRTQPCRTTVGPAVHRIGSAKHLSVPTVRYPERRKRLQWRRMRGVRRLMANTGRLTLHCAASRAARVACPATGDARSAAVCKAALFVLFGRGGSKLRHCARPFRQEEIHRLGGHIVEVQFQVQRAGFVGHCCLSD